MARSERFLDELLRPWPEERGRFTVTNGGKHEKLLLDGGLVMVLPRSPKMNHRRLSNARALVRRCLVSGTC